MEEEKKETPVVAEKKKRDFLLPASILISALLISISLVYNAGKKSDAAQNTANLAGAAQNTAEITLPPITSADHIEGNPNAPVKIIEYSDLECPFCKEFHSTLKALSGIYGDQVAIVYRHYPIPQLHPKAPHEAQAAECAFKLGGNNAFWSFIDQVFAITPSNNGLDPAELPKIAGQIGLDVNEFNSCLSSDYGQALITQESQDAVTAGAQGTPYSIVVNNAGKKYVINGALPLANVRSIIDQALKDSNS
ncbi:DsbA family protein [Patescibacteria group bacterium]|nr:DsbA family protein [Patescibacteria group bacterium]